MKKLGILFAFAAFTVLSCNHEKDQDLTSLNCLDQFWTNQGMVKYTGQTLGCINSYYVHFELDGKSYLLLDNPCADMLSIPVDCNGTSYFAPYEPAEIPEAAWQYFFQNAVNKGIIAVKI